MTHTAAIAVLVVLAGVAVLACDSAIHLPAPPSGTADAAAPPGDAASTDAARSRCLRDADCSSSLLHCDGATGACFECTSDAHCTREGSNRCDVALRRCVECGVQADCPSGMTCEPSTRKCVVGCSATTSCPSDAPTCDVVRGVCVACTVATSCTDASRPNCENASGRCVECTMDAHCGEEPRCDTVAGRCVECLSAADCSPDEPICDPDGWQCRQ